MKKGEGRMEDINIALLIDSDNVSAKYIQSILSELSKYGKVTIRRMYGDWSKDRLRPWLNCSAQYSLEPIMQMNNTPGKNASDIGLIIDAMDLLYTNNVGGFCLATSDGDFNKLAKRLREAGKMVIGMGEKKTPESFRASCERFIFLDVIDSENEGADDVVPAKTKASRSKKTAAKEPAKETASTRGRKSAAKEPQEIGAYKLPASTPLMISEPTYPYTYDADEDGEADVPLFTDKATIERAIVKMITDNAAEGKDTNLGEIGSRLQKIFPDFDIRNYHYTKLSEYVKDFSSLSVTTQDNNVLVTLKGSSDSEIEKQIRRIFERHNTKDLDLGLLKEELTELNPNLNASIRKSGVTRFNVYLNREIPSVEVNGSIVTLKG